MQQFNYFTALLLIPFLVEYCQSHQFHQCAYKSPRPSEVIKSTRELRSTRKYRHLPERFHIHHVLDGSVEKQPDYLIDHIKNVLIPQATSFWTANLRLKGGKTNGILLERFV